MKPSGATWEVVPGELAVEEGDNKGGPCARPAPWAAGTPSGGGILASSPRQDGRGAAIPAHSCVIWLPAASRRCSDTLACLHSKHPHAARKRTLKLRGSREAAFCARRGRPRACAVAASVLLGDAPAAQPPGGTCCPGLLASRCCPPRSGKESSRARAWPTSACMQTH